jgi:thymidylate synthase (FAD)
MLFNRYIANHYDQAMAIYNDMLRAGIAKECAREVLPMGTRTTLYMNGSVRSWLHYCDLRCGNGTQLEHRLIAEGCKELINRCFPKVYEAKWGA